MNCSKIGRRAMRIKLVFNILGKLLLIIGASMFFPLLWSLYYQEKDALPIFYAMICTLFAGGVLYCSFKSQETVRQRESYAIVTLGWILVSFFGALPYLFSGTLPSLADAYFETMSGFTTTGASVLTDIEAVSHGVLFWRSLTHWLGGMGIMVLFVALLTQLGGGGMQMFKAESPGPVAEKIKPRIKETAKILWGTYVIITAILVVLLLLGGMSLFDALCHAFGTTATGGFSTKNLSAGFYNPYIQWVLTIFMFASGANFALYYLAFSKKINSFRQSEEFKLYLFIVLGAVLVIFLDLMHHQPGGIEETLRASAFQVSSVITTTGMMSTDFNLWPPLSKIILLLVMLIGGCAGSTAGAIKVGRILILFKYTAVELFKLVHPRSVRTVKVDQRIVTSDVLMNTMLFFFLYIVIIGLGTAAMGAIGLGLLEALTSVMTTLGNCGPGLGAVGPASNFSAVPAAGKWVLSFCMLIGRLEIFTVLVLFFPNIWRKN